MPQLSGFSSVPIRGPRPWPVVGAPRQLFQFLADPVGVVMRLRAYGEVAAVVDQSPAIVCVFGAERNREVLSNPGAFRHDEDFFQGPPGSALDTMRSALVAI